ncbi:nucleotide sugar dehydrogenase [Microbacterium dauci]|uniref:UDP-glucose 6-dehydrogenase n=1 Tax=Microbacterium dauci TaxID=3048008 RepID=A0ABT6ZE94_9MICO|nr:nucleotide sugar dehydrogenase [Microbacterium sp. LX3-4]MDJ1114486.1 nucleotide sugar dehydrogenase [Microbacterium sp. LX3-4]
MKIVILGLGYVGMTAAACLAHSGHTVVGIDPNYEKVRTVNKGSSPISEPGMDEIVAERVASGALVARAQLDEAADGAELAIVCVGTPSAADGSHNMAYIAGASHQLAEFIAERGTPMTVAFRSTVKPGTMEEFVLPIFESVLGDRIDLLELVYNPEFLRESTAIADFFSPPKIVVGTVDGEPSAVIDAINEGIDAPTFYVKYRESEITKLVDNSFHAVKTAFANEIGRVCVDLGISAAEVHKIFISDTKLNISPYYLRPGGAFGGSCLPKDVRALQYIARRTGSNTHLVDSLIDSNEAHKLFLFNFVTKGLEHGAKVLLLGLAFKNESDDLRESPNIDLARMLLTAGYDLSIYDPYVHPDTLMGENLGVLSNSPFVRKLLVTEARVTEDTWDRIIDSRSIAHTLDIDADRVVNINRLA